MAGKSERLRSISLSEHPKKSQGIADTGLSGYRPAHVKYYGENFIESLQYIHDAVMCIM